MTQENVKDYTVDDKVVFGFYVLFFDVLPHEKKVNVSQEFNDSTTPLQFQLLHNPVFPLAETRCKMDESTSEWDTCHKQQICSVKVHFTAESRFNRSCTSWII